MSNKLTMVELYNKLEKLGFSKEFIRAIGLPSWWVEELDQSTSVAVMYEAAGYISKRLFIDLGSLIRITKAPRFINNMTYEEVRELLKISKQFIIVNETSLLEESIDFLSDDEIDYYEQLLVLDI